MLTINKLIQNILVTILQRINTALIQKVPTCHPYRVHAFRILIKACTING